MSGGSTSVTLEPISVYGSAPAANPALASELGLPADALFQAPERAMGYADYKLPGDDLSNQDYRRAYFDADARKDDNWAPPSPTAPKPHPPELIPDTHEAIAVCTSPDVCRSPSRPVPYSVWGKGNDKENYSPDVRSNGQVIKRHDSRFTTTYGDEPGTGKGVKSNTVGRKVEPVTSSKIVRANGVPVQRHGDACTLNDGNCPGEYVHVKSTETHAAPDGHDQMSKPWYERFWDQARDKSETIQAGESIVGRAGEYWNDPSAIGRDVRGAYESLPTAGEAWDKAKTTAGNIATGAGNVAERVWTDPVGSAQAAGGYVRDQAVGAVEGTKRIYQEGGLAGVAGAGAGIGLEVFSPGRKLKEAKRVGEALEGLGDVAKAEHRLKEAEKAGKTASESGDGGARSTQKKRTRNPCAHLATGNPEGKGPYRGGSYGGVPGSELAGIESHHTPAKSAYPEDLADKVGGINRMPAIQMDINDHRETGSHGWQGADGNNYRQQQRELMRNSQYRDAVSKDLRDVRRIAKEDGNPNKYNRAMLESAAYRRCLERHGLIPGKKRG